MKIVIGSNGILKCIFNVTWPMMSDIYAKVRIDNYEKLRMKSSKSINRQVKQKLQLSCMNSMLYGINVNTLKWFSMALDLIRSRLEL